jgi:hypothetical protein
MTPELSLEVVLAGTGMVEKAVGTATLVMVSVWSADSVLDLEWWKKGGGEKIWWRLELVAVFLAGTMEKPKPVEVFLTGTMKKPELVVAFLMGTMEKGSLTLVVVLDSSCDSSDSDWDLENGAGSDAVLTGTVEKPVGVQIMRVSVTVATAILEVPVRVHLVRVSVTVVTGIEGSLEVSGIGEDGGACSEGGGGGEELGGGTTTETLVETTNEVDGTTEVDATIAVDVSTFLLEAKSTLALASPVVILPLR